MYKNIYLKHGKEESLKRFHPWIFSGAIHHMDDGIAEGDTVRVITADGDCIAVGHYQKGTITIRVLSFQDIVIDESFWRSRIILTITRTGWYMARAIACPDWLLTATARQQ